MISPLGAIALIAIAWLTSQGRRLPGWQPAGLALVFVQVISLILPDPRGLRAKHYANTEFADPVEYSTEFQALDYTRIDRALDFTPERHEIPRHWINDLARFNFYIGGPPNQPTNRELLPYSVQWDGYWWVDTPGDVLGLYLDAPGATGELVIDGVKVLTIAPADGSRTASATPLRGWHQIVVRVSVPGDAPGRVSAGRLIDNQRYPFDVTSVSQKRLAAWQRIGYRAIDLAWAIVTFAILAWLVMLIVLDLIESLAIYRSRGGTVIANRPAVVRVLALAAAAESLWFAWPWIGRVMILPGGDDTLTYEWYARHIQTDGILMPHVQEPFFYQVFYPYFLAGVHGVFGESMFGVMLCQRLFVWFIAWAIMHIATKLYRADIWREALVFGGVFSLSKVAPIFAKPLNESLFIPLLAAWTISLLSALDAPSTIAAVRSGILAGFAALTRTTSLLAIAVSLPFTWSMWKTSPARMKLIGRTLACAAVVVSFITIRNAAVAHVFKPLPGEFGVTFAGGNEPPPGLAIDPGKHQALYQALHVDDNTAHVIEFALTAPAAFATNLWHKALFAFGYYEPYAPGFGSSVMFIVVSIAGFVGLRYVVRAKQVPFAVAILPALIAFSQFAAVVIIYPKHERLILPFQVMFAPYAAVAIEKLWTEFISR